MDTWQMEEIMIPLSPSKFYAAEQCQGRRDDENRVIGFANGTWMGVAIWAIAIAVGVVIGYSGG